MINSVPLFTYLNPCPKCGSEDYFEETTDIRCYPSENHSILKEYQCNKCNHEWDEEYPESDVLKVVDFDGS